MCAFNYDYDRQLLSSDLSHCDSSYSNIQSETVFYSVVVQTRPHSLTNVPPCVLFPRFPETAKEGRVICDMAGIQIIKMLMVNCEQAN